MAVRYAFLDSTVALTFALFINAAILIVAAATFHRSGHTDVAEIQQAYQLLTPLLGVTGASAVFAMALLASGQNSTLTGTLAGQIVMEGFLNFRMRPWLRRLITRMLAITPAALTIYISGEGSIYKLLILSQVILSMQLPFAVIPLIHFTNDPRRMGSFANARWVRWLAWTTAAIIVALNVRLAAMALSDWLSGAGPWQTVLWFVTVPVVVGLALLLIWVTAEPLVRRWLRTSGRAAISFPDTAGAAAAAP